MAAEVTHVLAALAVGTGATLFMDVWALFARRVFGVAPPNYCLVGRWIGYMPRGTFVHVDISATPKRRGECLLGWGTHYVVGVIYAFAFLAIASIGWLARPTFLPALLLGVASVAVPYLVMQPAFGLGVAASKAPRPAQARLRSLMAHVAYGVGLFVCALGVSYVLPLHV